MKAAFVWAQPVSTDATEWHKSLPRTLRKTLRIPKTVTKDSNSGHTDLTETFRRDRPMYDHDLALNTCDPDFCIDEFDDDYGMDDLTTHCLNAGLTIVAPGKDTRRWLKGYNIL